MGTLSPRKAVNRMQNDNATALAHTAGDRSRARRRILIYTPALLLLALLQTTFFPRFPLFAQIPDLCLVFILGVAMFDGTDSGGAVGIAAGFLLSALGSSGISLLPLIYFIIGYGTAHLAGRALARTFPSYMVFSLVLSLIRSLITLAAIGLAAQPSFFDLTVILRHTLFPEFLATLLASVPMYPVIRKIVRTAQKTR